jgi:LacI family transcriptional regulator
MEHLKETWDDRRAPTLKDVARAVGISEATASVVLNGSKSGTRVSAARRQAVVEAAARIGYRPNSVARALQAGRNHRIGIYSGRAEFDARNLFFAELLGGMCTAARALGSNVVLHTSGDDPGQLLELVSSAALDGLLVHASHDDPIVPLLGELRAPAVAIADKVAGLHSVGVDDALGGVLQAEHLARKGHRHVLYKQVRYLPQSAFDRMEAFLRTAKSLGMRVTVRYEERFEEPFDASDVALVRSGEGRPTAVVAWHDRSAELACIRLRDEGIDIPGEVAVVGFDGFRSYYSSLFNLTTVRAPWHQVGQVATEHLARLTSGEAVPLLTTLPVELLQGDTT